MRATDAMLPLCVLGRGPLVVVMPLPARLEELHLGAADTIVSGIRPHCPRPKADLEPTHLVLARSPVLLLEVAVGHLGILVWLASRQYRNREASAGAASRTGTSRAENALVPAARRTRTHTHTAVSSPGPAECRRALQRHWQVCLPLVRLVVAGCRRGHVILLVVRHGCPCACPRRNLLCGCAGFQPSGRPGLSGFDGSNG